MKPKAKQKVSVDRLRKILESYRFRYTGEKELQKGIALALTQEGIQFEQEKDLGEHGIVDFMINGIALEVKIKGSPSAVARQLIRYCQSNAVREVMLFTGRSRLGQLPSKLGGKRLHVVTLWVSFL